MWPVVILEFAPYGSLQDFLVSGRFNIKWPGLLSLCGDIAEALDWIHGCKVVHSDVKCENVLVTVTERSTSDFHFIAKLCDFGFALDMNAFEELDIKSAYLDGYTPPWQRPEANQAIAIDLLPAADVYCFGILACRVFLKGEDPFASALPGLEGNDVQGVKSFVEVLQHADRMSSQLTYVCMLQQWYNPQESKLIKALFEMTVRTSPEARSSMGEICELLGRSASSQA
jgi:serine/threonine protein kinase